MLYTNSLAPVIILRTSAKRTDKESVIYKHLRYCNQSKHIDGLYNLPDIFINENHPPSTAMNKEFLTQTVRLFDAHRRTISHR